MPSLQLRVLDAALWGIARPARPTAPECAVGAACGASFAHMLLAAPAAPLGAGGCTLKKTATAVVIGIYGEGVPHGALCRRCCLCTGVGARVVSCAAEGVPHGALCRRCLCAGVGTSVGPGSALMLHHTPACSSSEACAERKPCLRCHAATPLQPLAAVTAAASASACWCRAPAIC